MKKCHFGKSVPPYHELKSHYLALPPKFAHYGGGVGKVFLMMLKNADLVVWGIPKSMHFATDIFTWYSLQMILETEHLKIKS